MQKPYVLYVCEVCYENAPEGCGRADPSEIAVMPDGTWLCEYCADEIEVISECGVTPGGEDGDEWPMFNDFPHPAKYVAVQATEQNGTGK